MKRIATSRTPVTRSIVWMVLASSLAVPAGGRAAEPAAPAGANQNVMFHGVKATKILFLGNSITLHEPAPAIGWLGSWGMAASTKDQDYVHIVLQAIAQAAGKEPQSMVVNIVGFERTYATYDTEVQFDKALAFKADLVIVAIGENVPALGTDQAKADFQASVTKLLGTLKTNGDPVIVVRSCFWRNPAKDAALQAACGEVGGRFVDISALGKDAANMARSERKFANNAVGSHPGDRGMKAIADAILQVLSRR